MDEAALSGDDASDVSEAEDESEDPQYVKDIRKFMRRAIKNGKYK